ncbi:hypothetical protein [Apilactobacillus ozensis]|uniref:hypothetical protein n=1 Tax=Apilactobacillus ozensis TaxID=866801 RepID=UPI00200B3440|nr:hypothetical protein [Apilactobacillus ozensis]MCK8607186.1 hypothetical protein [Apilactobacillus ozensis]
MKKTILKNYTFYYDDEMTYFYDSKCNKALFVKIFDIKNKIINYDGAQLIIYFNENSIKLNPLWNVNIIQKNSGSYILKSEN